MSSLYCNCTKYIEFEPQSHSQTSEPSFLFVYKSTQLEMQNTFVPPNRVHCGLVCFYRNLAAMGILAPQFGVARPLMKLLYYQEGSWVIVTNSTQITFLQFSRYFHLLFFTQSLYGSLEMERYFHFAD